MGEIMKLEMDGIVLMGKFSVLFARRLMALFKWSQKKIIENPRSNEVSIKDKIFSRVDFPHPEGPLTQIKQGEEISMSILFNTILLS